MADRLLAYMASLPKSFIEQLANANSDYEKLAALMMLSDVQRDELSVLAGDNDDSLSCLLKFIEQHNLALKGAIDQGNAKLADQIIELLIVGALPIKPELHRAGDRLIREKRKSRGRPKNDDSLYNYLVQIKAALKNISFSEAWNLTFENLGDGLGTTGKARPAILKDAPLELIAGEIISILQRHPSPKGKTNQLEHMLNRVGLTLSDLANYLSRD